MCHIDPVLSQFTTFNMLQEKKIPPTWIVGPNKLYMGNMVSQKFYINVPRGKNFKIYSIQGPTQLQCQILFICPGSICIWRI